MQKLNISNLPTYWLTCEKTKTRWPKIEHLLNTLSILDSTKIDKGITVPYTIGIAKNHIEALTLGKKKNRPFLVIEDDVALNPNCTDRVISIPECDALYIGTSIFGRIRGTTQIGGCVVCNDGDYFKPINMLGMHAIIYNSHKYIDHTIKILEDFIDSKPIVHPDIGCDNPIAEQLWKFNIKVQKVPMFYQNDGHTERASLTPLIPIC